MNFLFLFGLIFLSGCVYRQDVKDRDTKASKAEINKDEGGAFVTPSKNLKALRLQSTTSPEVHSQKEVQSLGVLVSKEVIQARLSDVPVLIGAQLLDASVDKNNNKYLVYTSAQEVDEIVAAYNDELQRFGWVVKLLYSDAEYVCITAKKPHKSAVFSIKNHKSSWVSASYRTLSIIVSVS